MPNRRYKKYKRYRRTTDNLNLSIVSDPGPSDPNRRRTQDITVVKEQKRTDYVFVYSKTDLTLHAYRQDMISAYINNVKQTGLTIQEEIGLVLDDLVCIKVSAPTAVLTKYANQYNLELTKDNPYYKYPQKIFIKSMGNVATSPQPDHPVVRRAEESLSGNRPADFTNAERIMIVDRILCQTKYGSGKADIGFGNLVSRGIFLAAYPLHDSPYEWAESGPLSDRQLLAKYWASIWCIHKEQPLTLIEKYYGPEVGFYFAWMGCYTKMLVIPAALALVFFLVGLIYFYFDNKHIEKEVCNSDVLLCPVCPSQEWCIFVPIKNFCTLMKLANVLANPITVIYSLLMSFWGISFLMIWRRKQAMLRVRWNLTDVTVDRSVRPEFINVATIQRMSSLTGQKEYYLSAFKRSYRLFFSYAGVVIMFFVFCLHVVIVIYYRLNVGYYGRKSNNRDFKQGLEMFTTVTSSFVTFVIMIFIDTFKSKLSRMFTEWENPRTQEDFNRQYTIKLVSFSIGNTFFPLIYLAFVKGHFYTHPGDPAQWTFRGLFRSDVCPISGCLVDLSVQLLTIMLLKNTMRLFTEVMVPVLKVFIGKFRVAGNITTTQWEEDFILVPTTRNDLYGEYIQMVLQYGFMTFFLVSLPIAPILAFLNNIFELRFDAMKMLKHHRRAIPKKVTGIEEWNIIIQMITVLGAISNPLLIAFNSKLIPRYLYLSRNKSLDGFINSTLSDFLVLDYPAHINERKLVETCKYYGNRYPHTHPEKYELTIDYWHQFAIKAIFFIILENICLLLCLFLGYIIPEIPRKVQIKLENEQQTLRKLRLARDNLF